MNNIEFTAENIERWRNEEFDDELLPYVTEHETFGQMLQHPLVYDMMPVMPGLANLRLKAKKEALELAISRDDLSQIIGLHERPYRFEALQEYALTEGFTIWQHNEEVQELVEFVWTDSENIHQHREEWIALFQDRPDGEMLGDEEEFRKLSDPVKVYRGVDDSSFLSWSTDESVAEFFARRAGTEVISRWIEKRDIFAYFTGRNESEVLSFAGMG